MFRPRTNYVGKLEVLESASGFYIGRLFYHTDNEFEPYSRESQYYPTRESAQRDLYGDVGILEIDDSNSKERYF